MPATLPETNCSAPVRGADPPRQKRRTHSDQQVAQIAASIREFGFTNPVLIDDEHETRRHTIYWLQRGNSNYYQIN